MKISIPGFIYAKGTRRFDVKTSRYLEGPAYSFWESGDLHKSEHFHDYALVGPHEIIAEIPDSFDPRQNSRRTFGLKRSACRPSSTSA